MKIVKFRDVRFKSFVKLVEIKESDVRFRIPVSLTYNGSELRGDVEIDIGDCRLNEDFIKIASETLQW